MFLKMNCFQLILLVFIGFTIITPFLIYTCNAENEVAEKTFELNNFDFLRRGMTYKEVIEKAGKPDIIDDSNKGFISIKYCLRDDSVLILDFGIHDMVIIYAYLEKPNGEMKLYLIKREIPLELNDFDFLKIGMNYWEIVEKVGRPDAPAGSGVFMVKYILKDGSGLILNFGSGIKLERAILERSKGEFVVIIQ